VSLWGFVLEYHHKKLSGWLVLFMGWAALHQGKKGGNFLQTPSIQNRQNTSIVPKEVLTGKDPV